MRSRFGAAVRRTRSIRARLSLVFLFLFGLLLVLGVFSIGSLTYLNAASSQVRDRSLPSTRFLGDLNNLTSDFRAAEAATLLASNAQELGASEQEMAALDRGIAAAQLGYRQIPHNATEDRLYALFVGRWTDYRSIVRDTQGLAPEIRAEGALAAFKTRSKTAYDAASNALGLLTDENVASAQNATRRAVMAYSRARDVIILTIVVAGLLIGSATIYVRRSISKPLLGLSHRMRKLAANETDMDVDCKARQDEIGEMARAVAVFRENAIELMASRRGLAQQASMLQEKLAEEQRLMRLQRNFVSMASHEFRTPLTIIDAHAQRMITLRQRLDGEQFAERARKIRAAVSRMTHLIRNLIDSSQVVDGEVQLYLHPTRMDLNKVLREACHVQREIAPHAQILENFADAAVSLPGDSNLLFQVFSNLLSNAVKYSPATVFIRLTLELQQSHVVVHIEDRGIGLVESDRHRLFERYYRGGNVSGIVGTGIGLYFVKTVVELHGGEVSAANLDGGGSRFTVRLQRDPTLAHSSSARALDRVS
jgi:two-component system OmpR family sensor kinase